MKKILCLFMLICSFLLTACSIKEQEPENILERAQKRGYFIVGGDFSTKPFCFMNENNKPDGLEVQIAKNVAKVAFGNEDSIQYIQVGDTDAFTKVALGEIDFAIGGTTITERRMLIVDFSESFYTTGQALLVRKNGPIKKIKDLNKRVLLFILNTTAEKTPKKYAPFVKMLGYKDRSAMYNDFKKGIGDAVISDAALMLDFVKQNPDFEILPQRLTVEPYGLVIQNSDNAKSLKNTINMTISAMKTDGTLDALKHKWEL